MPQPAFGAGIWHFATYVDRYATDGYGEPVTLLESIDRAGAVGDLSYVDLTYPFSDPELTLGEVKAAIERNNLKTIASLPRSTPGCSPRAPLPTPTLGSAAVLTS
jgi:xylose isomerase